MITVVSNGTELHLGIAQTAAYRDTMQLTDAEIAELQALWKEAFAEEITMERAAEVGDRLVAFYVALDAPCDAASRPSETPDGPRIP